MSILVCLVGAQASSKSTVEKWVNEELGIPRLISHTTRPQRDGERDDEYHFVTKEQFEKERLLGNFVETREYIVANGETWSYGVHKNSIDSPVHIVVVDYKGFTELRAQYKVIGIHLDISKDESFKRVLENRPGYSEEESVRRFSSDVVDIQLPSRNDKLMIKMNSEQDLNETLKDVRTYIKMAKLGFDENKLYEQWVEERIYKWGGAVKMMNSRIKN